MKCSSVPMKTCCLGVLHSCEVCALPLKTLAPPRGCRAAALFCQSQMLNLAAASSANWACSLISSFLPTMDPTPSNWFMLVPSIIVLDTSCALSSPSFKERHCAQISAGPCPLVNFRFITPAAWISYCLKWLASKQRFTFLQNSEFLHQNHSPSLPTFSSSTTC